MGRMIVAKGQRRSGREPKKPKANKNKKKLTQSASLSTVPSSTNKTPTR